MGRLTSQTSYPSNRIEGTLPSPIWHSPRSRSNATLRPCVMGKRLEQSDGRDEESAAKQGGCDRVILTDDSHHGDDGDPRQK